MNFRRGSRDEPEINLIPFIDVLLVVLIFLMLSTMPSSNATTPRKSSWRSAVMAAT
jgi:biopolymer transport protein ExbD